MEQPTAGSDNGQTSRSWFNGGFLFWPIIKHRFLETPFLHQHRFFYGATSGALFYITLLLNAVVWLFLLIARETMFGGLGAGMAVIFLVVFALPWGAMIGPSTNTFFALAFGIATNIVLVSLSWGLIELVRSKLRKEPR